MPLYIFNRGQTDGISLSHLRPHSSPDSPRGVLPSYPSPVQPPSSTSISTTSSPLSNSARSYRPAVSGDQVRPSTCKLTHIDKVLQFIMHTIPYIHQYILHLVSIIALLIYASSSSFLSICLSKHQVVVGCWAMAESLNLISLDPL